jgi:hypothetical protein
LKIEKKERRENRILLEENLCKNKSNKELRMKVLQMKMRLLKEEIWIYKMMEICTI